MNPFFNPRILFPFLKNWTFDSRRLDRLNPEKLNRYKDKMFKKILKYAYTVPVYHEKFNEAGIHPNNIHGIGDINKIPFISRQDFANHYPDGIISSKFNKDKGFLICTGGTTTKYCCNSGAQPVCTYTDFLSLVRGSNISFRVNNYFNLKFKETRFVHIGNFNPYKFDSVLEENVLKYAKTFVSMENQLSLQASNKTFEIMKKLEEFKPDVIISYPAIFQDLAFLKRKGYGSNINPRVLFVGGAMLDNYTRAYVQNAFNCNMYNTYASCESGGEIAFECKMRNWHIHTDFFHLEAVDEKMNLVEPGERGRLVITKLWGNGTPIIRYTGMEDWITLDNGKKCSCGLKSPIFDKPVEGRISSNIVLPNGQVYPPSRFLFITDVLRDLKTFKVKKYQIVQDKINEIDILIEIDNDLRNKGIPVSELINKIKLAYQNVTGPKVKINVKEVEKIDDDPDSGKPAPLIISNAVCQMT